MKLHLFTAALVLLCACGQVNAEVDQHAVLVHLRPGSATASHWIGANRSGTLSDLTRIIGEHTSTGYVSNATLKAIEAANTKSIGMRKQQPQEAISHIALVRYTSSIPPQIAARKIAQFPDVEYCEPLPVFRLLGSTNDPLLPQQYYINLINAVDAWDSLPQGSSIIVGIADTGIDTTFDSFSFVSYMKHQSISIIIIRFFYDPIIYFFWMLVNMWWICTDDSSGKT